MTIAITGASGELGHIVVSKLTEKVSSSEIVAVVRNVTKAKDLGVSVRQADYGDVSALGKAFDGIETVLLISSSEIGQRATQHKNVIESAKKVGVKRIVYTSVLRAPTSTLSLAGEHVETEKVLKESGLKYTILRNGWYTENFDSRIESAPKVGSLVGSAGDGKVSAATREDYAEAAVAALTGQDHENKIYELAGDNSFTLTDLATEISKVSGKEIPYKNVSEKEFASILTQSGLSEGLAGAFASFDVSTANGDLYDDTHQLSKLIGRPTTPYTKLVAKILSSN